MIQTPITDALSTSYAAVALGADVACSGLLCKTRSGTAWRISDIEAGTTYFSVGGDQSIEIPINKGKGAAATTMFWARTEAGTDTLETFVQGT
jgi:hypothetical protein